MLSLTVVCLLLLGCLLVSGQVKLGTYNIDSSQITVSGISSGGSMATQLHVAFSSFFSGSGSVAGPPYWCAQGQVMYATTGCMTGLGLTVATSTMINKANEYSRAGSIDNVSNLANGRYYFYSGTRDSTVVPSVVKKGEEFMRSFVPDSSRIKTVYSYASVHGHPTDNYGSACGTTDRSYINNCNYNAAHDMLSHLLNQNLVKPGQYDGPTGQFIQFDQKEFYPTGVTTTALSMETFGYLYVPTRCANTSNKCRLHIALHGCLQAPKNIGDIYVKNAGYNQVADANDLIILYPSATSSLLSNPNACWDWWGYINANYAIKTGPQMQAIMSMIKRVAGDFPTNPATQPAPATTASPCVCQQEL